MCDELPEIADGEPFEEFKLFDMPAAAGTGTYLEDENFKIVRFPYGKAPANTDFCIRVSGDSMEPIFRSGQIAFIRQCSEVNRGDVGIFILNGFSYIKQYAERAPAYQEVEAYTDSRGRVHNKAYLVSFNRKYRPIPIRPTDNLSVVGKVLK